MKRISLKQLISLEKLWIRNTRRIGPALSEPSSMAKLTMMKDITLDSF